MARRVSYTNAFKERFKKLPTLLVDSGAFLADERTTHGELRADQNVKNELILKAYDQYQVDVANLSAHDFGYMSKLLKVNNRLNSPPVVKRFISANTIFESSDFIAPQPFLIREISAGVGGKSSKPIRIAFVGLCEESPQPPFGLRITDPVEAAKRVIPQARKQADLVIVLAHGKVNEVLRIAREVTGIDAMIAGTGDMFTPPMRVGETLIAFTAYETRFLGEVRFYRDDQGKFSTKERFISLDIGVGDDQPAMKAAAEVTDANLKSYKANQASLNEWMAKAQAGSSTNAGATGNGPYASSHACAQCHAEQYFKWANGPHARSAETISLKQTEADVSCLACHASGLQKSGVLGSGEIPKLLNVQCEQCHGPGSQHIAKPAKGYGRIANLKETCSGCHTPRVSPKFDLEASWAKIKH